MVIRFKDSNFFEKVSVSSTDWVLVAKWNFISQGIALLLEGNVAGDRVEYCFSDEFVVAGDLTYGLPSQGLIFDHRAASLIYARKAAGSGSIPLRIETWR